MKSINFMGDNGFKKALESVGVTASSSISSEKISGCFKYVTADDMCIITGYCGDSHIEVLELPFARALEMMRSGEIMDGKAVILLQYLQTTGLMNADFERK